MDQRISVISQHLSQMNVDDLPSIMIDGNPALVKKIYGSYSSDYGADSEPNYYIETVFISSKTNRTIEICNIKNYEDFTDSENRVSQTSLEHLEGN